MSFGHRFQDCFAAADLSVSPYGVNLDFDDATWEFV
jgi:hypothetical protein